MIENGILGIVGILTGTVILISTLGFIYFMRSAYRYGSRDEANKFFGSYMFNNPKRYIIAFLFLVLAGMSLSIGFIFAFIASFFISPLVIWELLSSVSLIALAGFFVTFTSIDHPKSFLSYIAFLKAKKKNK
ncbi:MAG: hypothetical protein QXD02_05125 [Candidatus Parvarchaeum sp.]|nr:hypothetical protein [Candidatus Parvarchaeota archaeon]MCW1294291.1 hypothetical protein [Candidatus Parvarchaeum tengchongense]MCW1295353.1 hypothetical protein [Candidatus Parvarchaeum tengchongense]MCW1299672.1 hypothetical protein [Candidatus Parvarchaeum tengchongense]